MLRYILLALFLLLFWAAVILFRLPEWIGIAVTAVVVVGVVALYLWRRRVARRAARELEQSLVAQAEEHAKSVRPDMQEEIRALQGEFGKAIASLKGSKLAKSGMDALSALPWYVIIGPPGAGKSTALRNSGLHFPFLSQKGGGVKGVGGTRNCEWWLTNEAVILDTAGRYTTEEDDREEWFAFLDLLKKHRPRQPANGILVAISVDELGGAGEDEVVSIAQRVRERIDEVAERLKMVVPIYVLFTKCDLVPGFVESFADLRKQERGQIWGATLRLHGERRPPRELFEEGFDELVAIVEKRALGRLGQERNLGARQRIFEFPQQMLALRQNLAEFVGTLLEENVYQETPILRGVYFTSGTQEGRPIDRVVNAMAQAFGIHPSMPEQEPVVEAKSYFLRDVFGKVIFPDQKVAARTADEQRRQSFVRYGTAAAVIALAGLVTSLPGYGYQRNRELVGGARSIVDSVGAQTAGPVTPQKLDELRALVEKLKKYEDEGPPFLMRLGMYQGARLYPPVRDFYTGTLRTGVVKSLLQRDVGELRAFSRRTSESDQVPTTEDHARFRDAVKLHLLLTAPKEATEPPLDAERQTFVVEQLVERWKRLLGTPGLDSAALATKMKVYVELVAADPKLLFPRNAQVVQAARVALRKQPVTSLLLDQMISEVAQEDLDLDLQKIMGSALPQVRSEKRVRGAFTRRGWEQHIRKRLSGPLQLDEGWVVDPQGGADAEEKRAAEARSKLRARYFEVYIQEWKELIDSIRVSAPTSNAEALILLQDLTRGQPAPYGRLMASIAWNVRLEEDKSALDKAAAEAQKGALDKLRDKIGTNPVGAKVMGDVDRRLAGERMLTARDVDLAFKRFYQFGYAPPPAGDGAGGAGAPPPAAQALPIDVYQEQLALVRDALQGFTETKDPAPLEAKLEQARTRVKAIVESQEVGTRDRFAALLLPPIMAATKTSTTAIVGEKGRKWCSDVVVTFERKLATKYPFAPRGHDASLADVAEYFKPGKGTVWAFYQAELATKIVRNGDKFQFAPSVTGFKDTVRVFLERAQDVTTALFPGGSAEMWMDFDVRIRATPRVASVRVDFDGVGYEYHNGPEEWRSFRWPGEKGKRGASIRVKGAGGVNETIEQSGEWGLLRLVEAGAVKQTGAREFTVSWALQDQGLEIRMDFRPARSESPFFGVPGRPKKLLGLFRDPGLKVPRDIGGGHGVCDLK